jgi:hypothetical protein
MCDLFAGFSESQKNDHEFNASIERILAESDLPETFTDFLTEVYGEFVEKGHAKSFENAVKVAGNEEESWQLSKFIEEVAEPLWCDPGDFFSERGKVAGVFKEESIGNQPDGQFHEWPTTFSEQIKKHFYPDDPLAFAALMRSRNPRNSDPLIACLRLYNATNPYHALFEAVKNDSERLTKIEQVIWGRKLHYKEPDPKEILAAFTISLDWMKFLLMNGLLEDAQRLELDCRSRMYSFVDSGKQAPVEVWELYWKIKFTLLNDARARKDETAKKGWIISSIIVGLSFLDMELPAGQEEEYIDTCLEVGRWEVPKYAFTYSSGILTRCTSWDGAPRYNIGMNGTKMVHDPVPTKTVKIEKKHEIQYELENDIFSSLALRLLTSSHAKLAAQRITARIESASTQEKIEMLRYLLMASNPSMIENATPTWFKQEWLTQWKTMAKEAGAVKGELWHSYDDLHRWIKLVYSNKSKLGILEQELVPHADRALILLRRELDGEHALRKIEESHYFNGILLKYAPEKLLSNLFPAFRKATEPCSGEGLEFGAGNSILNAGMYKTPAYWWISVMINNCLRMEYAWHELSKRSENHITDEQAITQELRKAFAEYCWKSLRLNKNETCDDGEFYQESQCIETDPLWRQAFAAALGEIGLDLGGKVHKTLFFIKDHDPTENVRKAAEQAYKAVRRKHHHNEDDPVNGMLIAFWILRLAQRKALGVEINQAEATNTRRNELRYANHVREIVNLIK